MKQLTTSATLAVVSVVMLLTSGAPAVEAGFIADAACIEGTTWSKGGGGPCAACATDASCATGVKTACSATANTVCNTTPIIPDAVTSSFGVKTSYHSQVYNTKNVDRAFYGLYLANGVMKGKIAELQAGQAETKATLAELKTLLQARRLRLVKTTGAPAHTIPNMALHCIAATLAMAAAAMFF